jgi:hypothetical protein
MQTLPNALVIKYAPRQAHKSLSYQDSGSAGEAFDASDPGNYSCRNEAYDYKLPTGLGLLRSGTRSSALEQVRR